ncbi:MAG: ferrochelatase, partial [Actinomycetota bacterium]|nr:ferrochelatase [Actinomycetota bacterium]
YYTDIRGGRAPTPEHLRELKERYAAIGNRFPLLDITTQQAGGLERALNSSEGDGRFRAYLGMKHSRPFVGEGVAHMREDGIERAVGIVMAPHWSGMSIETYVQRVEKAVADEGGPSFTFVRRFHDHPGFVTFLAGRVSDALAQLTPEERDRAAVIFSAHSLPQRSLDDGATRCSHCDMCTTSCAYVEGLSETADLVSAELRGIDHTIGWQSAGRTADRWLGPPVEDVIRDLAERHSAIVVCSAGFVADHLEILYDLDIEAQEIAREAGVKLVRTEMPNADPAFTAVLADVVRKHLQSASVA